VERRIAEDSGGAVINIGAHHAQLSHLMGTEQEWLGDFLAHRSTVVDGSVIAIGFTSARTELEPGELPSTCAIRRPGTRSSV
jgi:hypothetical protein